MPDTKSEKLSEQTLFTIQDVAEMLQVAVRTVRRLRSTGKLPQPVTIGRSVRWRREDLEEWIAEGCPAKGQSKDRDSDG